MPLLWDTHMLNASLCSFLFIQVEKTRHLLLLREKLGEAAPVGTAPTTKSLSESLSPSMSSGTLSTSTSISSQISSTTFESAITPSESSGYDSTDIESLVDREKELATKVRGCNSGQDGGKQFILFYAASPPAL